MSDVRETGATAANEDGPGAAGGFIWYELMTPDPLGAKAFYEAVIPGWSIGERNPGNIDYRMIGRADGGNAGGILGMNENMREHGARPMWLGYLNVDDADDSVRSIEQAGGKALAPPFDVPGVGRIAMVADPQGAPFYVMKPNPPEGGEDAQSDVFSPDAEQRVSWNELSTSDPVAARKFYAGQFGWGTDEYMDMGEMGEYRFIERDGTRIGALCGVMPGQPPKWRYYIRVPSITASAEAIKSGGGSVAMGPHEVPGGDHIVIGIDPQGAEFALVGKA